MISERGQAEALRVSQIIAALADQEITFLEFSEAVESLTPEAIQVTASLLRNWNDFGSDELDPLWQVQLLCRRLASRTRQLS